MPETNSPINFNNLKEIAELETVLKLHTEAKAYLEAQSWCTNLIQTWYEPDLTIYEKVGVFLFEIAPANQTVDKFIWIIIGDLPTVYLDQSVKTGKEALEVYCDLMDDWANSVIEGNSLDDCFPVEVAPTIENAGQLKRRIDFIRRELLT
jgi:hypothetical protein